MRVHIVSAQHVFDTCAKLQNDCLKFACFISWHALMCVDAVSYMHMLPCAMT